MLRLVRFLQLLEISAVWKAKKCFGDTAISIDIIQKILQRIRGTLLFLSRADILFVLTFMIITAMNDLNVKNVLYSLSAVRWPQKVSLYGRPMFLLRLLH